MTACPLPRPISWFGLRRCCFAIGLAAAAAPSSAEPITFAHENVSDLRGILNVFEAFRHACLGQPMSLDLPEALVPEGYGIHSSMGHLWGDPGGFDGKTAVLSRTGSEEGDWEGGHAYVTLSMPSDADPFGRCRIDWRRAWDYAEGRDRIALGLFGVFDAQVSYRLTAVLRSPPGVAFTPDSPVRSGVSEWLTWCWDDKLCTFTVLYDFDPEDGIELSISRTDVQR